MGAPRPGTLERVRARARSFLPGQTLHVSTQYGSRH